ncbi:hypothetical protein [Salinimonas chungwhensis]|jgi:hypothetical protein|uniref:hypothetical protein n=1 Tax=Salinimonas chungwhensis TaxID=265425 RepID=UPI00035CAD94|nr:hypothetical protein [Salinimonas chungwhensis]
MAESSDLSLQALCQQIKDEGNQPSVAMLRAKAPFKISVTEAIAAIKSFNAAGMSRHAPKPAASVGDLEKRISELENAVALLEKRLSALDNNQAGDGAN